MVKPTVISTFAGCGGSSLGYKWAGFKELLATDFDDDSIKVFKANFPGVPTLQADIRQVTAAEILALVGLKPGELDVLDGSPPCQGFSHAGRRKVRDERNDLFKEYVRLVREIRPKVFVMENVAGMVSGRMKGRFLEILANLKGLDYRVRCRLMDSRYYDVPQARKRVIFIGVRGDLGLDPVFPKPGTKIISVRKAFEGLPPQVEDRPMPEWFREISPQVRPGMTFKHVATIFLKAKRSAAGCIATRRLEWGKPSPTVVKSEFGHAGLIHPGEDRYLTLAELKRLSTFPDDFIFTSRRLGIERIGNAVMPRFMFHVARAVREGILDRIGKWERMEAIGKAGNKAIRAQKDREMAEVWAGAAGDGPGRAKVKASRGGLTKEKGRAKRGRK
jgi:DNA (cytosine-5)-methyltransferase 1